MREHEGSEDRMMTAAAAGEREKRAYVRGIFEQIAPRYDLLNHLLSMNIDRRWRRHALARLGWESAPVGTYLDLCAGTLDVGTQLIASRKFAGFVIGADFAVNMLRAGRGKSPAARLGAVAADAQQLPVRDASVDGAIVAFGIRNVASLDCALRETFRVLRPGARFVILEFTTPANALVRSFYHLYFHRILPVIGGLVSGHGSAYRYLPASVANFPSEQALTERLRDAGFTDVSHESLSFGIAAVHVGTRP